MPRPPRSVPAVRGSPSAVHSAAAALDPLRQPPLADTGLTGSPIQLRAPRVEIPHHLDETIDPIVPVQLRLPGIPKGLIPLRPRAVQLGRPRLQVPPDLIFGGHLNRDVDRTAGWRPEYFIPVYVADAAKHAGFKGIRFSSTRSYRDVNLVVFDEDARVKADGKPFTFNLRASGEHLEF